MMNVYLAISLVALWGIVIVESAALQALCRNTLSLRRLLEPPAASGQPRDALGTTVTGFSARLLDSQDVITAADLRGQTTLLLFVAAMDMSAAASQLFSSVLRTFWPKYRESFYVVCRGAPEACAQLRDHYGLARSNERGIRVLLDEEGALARLFSVGAGATAVVVDETGNVAKVGGLLTQHDNRMIDLAGVTG